MSPIIRRKKSRSHNSPRRVIIWQVAIGVGCFMLLGIVGYGTWYISHLESLTIKNIKVRGGETISHEVVSKTAWATLEGSYYKLVPKRFVWTYPESSMLNAVQSIPRVKNASIEVTDRNTVDIKIEEYSPSALWCSTNDKNCLFLGESGFAFAKAPALSGSSFLRYQTTDKEPQLGSTMTNAKTMFDTAVLAESFAIDFDWPVSYVELSERGDINYHLIKGGILKTRREQVTVEVLDNLNTILLSDEFSHLATDEFQYIDLRFGDKVFIKEDLETDTATTTEGATNEETTEEE